MNMDLYEYSHIPMKPKYRKFNDDIFVCFLVIMKNVASSMTSSPWKILVYGIIWDNLFISEVKLKLCLIFWHHQNGRHFGVLTIFFTGSNTGSWIYQQDSHENFRYFDRRSSWYIDGDIAISKFDVLCYLVTSSMASWLHVTELAQLDIANYVPAKYCLCGTSASWLNHADKHREKHTNKQRSTQGEKTLSPSLSRVITSFWWLIYIPLISLFFQLYGSCNDIC